MNSKFIIEQIVMSMSFLKHTDFPDHKFIMPKEDEHGMYKCLKAVIDHPETGYLQEGTGHLATLLDSIKRATILNWSYVLDVLAELKTKDDLEDVKEVLENMYYWLLQRFSLPKVDLFLGVENKDNRNNPEGILEQSFRGGYLDENLFCKIASRIFDFNLDTQIAILVEVFDFPRPILGKIFEIPDSLERRRSVIRELHTILFTKPKRDSIGIQSENISQINIENCVGTSTQDDTAFVQQNLDKEYKETMMEEQFYTKLYFYTDVKRLLKNGEGVRAIEECFDKLSKRDKALVCNEFGITGCSPKHVPGIGVVLATMIVNTEMQVLKRKLTDVISHGYITELHTRIEQCTGWDDANKLHQYVQATFNGVPIEDLKDIIVKYMSLDNHDQFDHDGTQLAGFFAGVIYADAMTMVKRHEEQLQYKVGTSECVEGCQDCTQRVHGSVELNEADVLRARAYQEELGKLFGLYNNPTNKAQPQINFEDIAHTKLPRLFIIRG